MNLLSVARDLRRARAGLPARLGRTCSGSKASPQIEGWIPIFLFAVLFGLSMDYEVFLLSRMREEWDRRHDNEHAVAYGLEHTGRIITAAAIIMIAAFSGFTGRAASSACRSSASASRRRSCSTRPSSARSSCRRTMKLLGDWNWYLPERVRRALRLRPAPAEGSAGLR